MLLTLIQVLGGGLLLGFLLGIAVMLLFQEYSQEKVLKDSENQFFPLTAQLAKELSYPPEAKEEEHIYLLPPSQVGTPVAILTAFEGIYKGFSWTLNYATSSTIGRFDDCDIALNDHSISRLHAQITHHITASQSNKFALFDYSHRNQTLINGEPINTVASLKDGDQIQLGTMEFIFHRL